MVMQLGISLTLTTAIRPYIRRWTVATAFPRGGWFVSALRTWRCVAQPEKLCVCVCVGGGGQEMLNVFLQR